MTDALAVAVHWPFVRKHLSLDRARPARLALDLLAELQFRATGELARLGRARLRHECGLTAGEAGAVYNALCELEERRVVTRLRDAGSRPDAWGFRPDVRRWRAMPWRSSGRDVEAAITRCICSTNRAFAARSPGQGLTGAPHFWLSAEDHIRPPGLFLVDSRGKGARGGATARRPGEMPVDSRGKCAPARRPVLSSSLNDDVRRRWDVNDDVEKILREAAHRPLFGPPEAYLLELAALCSLDQATACARMLDDFRMHDGKPLRSPPLRVEKLWEFFRSPAVALLAEEA